MTCEDLKKNLEPFLDDLLTETEYEEFISHLEGCDKCRQYVRAIGSLSNRLWELGDVKVPADFVSTVLFKLKQPQQEPQRPGFAIRIRLAVSIAIIMIIASGLLFSGVWHLKSKSRPKNPDEKPVVITTLEEVPEVNSMEKEKKAPAAKTKEAAVKTSPDKPPVGALLAAENEAILPRIEHLHWHIQYSDENEKAQISDILTKYVAKPDYQTNDAVIFTEAKERIENILEQIMLMPQDPPFFSDFTSKVPTIPGGTYNVSIYFQDKADAFIHWHIAFMAPHQNSQMLEIIKKSAISINYESADVIIFSIPKTEYKNFKAKILSMRLGLMEFGNPESEEKFVITGQTVIYVYFTKR